MPETGTLSPYWVDVLTELQDVDPAVTATFDPIRSRSDVDVFDVRLLSIGGVAIAAWLAVPKYRATASTWRRYERDWSVDCEHRHRSVVARFPSY